MKILRLTFSLVFLFLFTHLYSQNIELSGTYGYQFGTKLDYFGGYVKLEDGSSVGASLGYNNGANMIFQFNYNRFEADVRLRDITFSPNESRIADATLDWFSIGAVRTSGDGPAYGYFGVGLGLLFSTPSNLNRDILQRNIGNSTNFFFDLKLGGTAMLNDNIGLRAQALLQCPIDYGGVYFGYGTGGPSSGVSLSSTAVIFSLQGGLVFIIPQ